MSMRGIQGCPPSGAAHRCARVLRLALLVLATKTDPYAGRSSSSNPVEIFFHIFLFFLLLPPLLLLLFFFLSFLPFLCFVFVFFAFLDAVISMIFI